ncbi:hypothetical protein FISHEDRAFT_48486 [Fistulina hepatica ATCC 64428]|uniref:Protein-lysine N-methyltransferase EFM6 n=1 Tax=Fistulina hepatica ATCC 64428 TaxID=1128425 RepID=A0A0D7A588_9AGAR|nr:hypothetical protein FISHEDRAFT_48486 [Fistulina hepatica ATCC 64428]
MTEEGKQSFADEENLDAQNPLRHLMHTGDHCVDGSANTEDDIVPEQPKSVLNSSVQLEFRSSSSGEPVSMRLALDASPGCGGVHWPAGQVLSQYLVHLGPDSLRCKKVLELGSGTGLVGLVAAQLGAAHVWITDQAPLLELMHKNVLMNDLESDVSVAELDWGTPVADGIPKPDVLLAADCVYFEPAFPLLVQTLYGLTDAETEILFCYKKRRKADRRFFTMLKKKFSWTEVSDSPERESYSKDAISLLTLHRKDVGV